MHPALKNVRPRKWRQAMSDLLFQRERLRAILEDDQKTIIAYANEMATKDKTIKGLNSEIAELRKQSELLNQAAQKIEELSEQIAEYHTYTGRMGLELEALRKELKDLREERELQRMTEARLGILLVERDDMAQQVLALKARMYDLIEAHGLI
jgi:uncharacterized coiled-coil protein SlyX